MQDLSSPTRDQASPSPLEVQSVNHWTARKVPWCLWFLKLPWRAHPMASVEDQCLQLEAQEVFFVKWVWGGCAWWKLHLPFSSWDPGPPPSSSPLLPMVFLSLGPRWWLSLSCGPRHQRWRRRSTCSTRNQSLLRSAWSTSWVGGLAGEWEEPPHLPSRTV